jgi:aspartate/methionine/tyrosine aminotransferase
MQKTKFPHMEWAKAHTKSPAPLELGFSGARRPDGPEYLELVGGDPVLEAKIARKYGVAKDHVYLTAGTSLANFVTLAAFVGRGDFVGVERPRYTPLAEIPGGLGGRVIDIVRRPGAGLGALPKKATVIVVTTPHNPTGQLLRDADWKKLARFADAGGIVVVDEVYRDLQDKPPAVAASRHPRFLTTAGVTKAYGLGGLRMGWVLGEPELLARVRRVNDLVSVQCSTPSIVALRAAWSRLPEFRRRALRPVARNLAALRRSGLKFIEPDAGLTAFVRVGDGDRCMEEMATRGVGVATGSFFGDNRYVRVYLGTEPAVFRAGIERLAAYLGGGRNSRSATLRKSGR